MNSGNLAPEPVLVLTTVLRHFRSVGDLAIREAQAPDFTVEKTGAYSEQDLPKTHGDRAGGGAGLIRRCSELVTGGGGAGGAEVLPSPPSPQYKVPLRSILGRVQLVGGGWGALGKPPAFFILGIPEEAIVGGRNVHPATPRGGAPFRAPDKPALCSPARAPPGRLSLARLSEHL